MENLNDRIEITKAKKIGSGGFGKVFVAYDKQLEKEVAIKLLNANENEEQDKKERFEHEINSLSQINHPLISKYLGRGIITYKNTEKIALLTEFYRNGNLRDILRKKEELSLIGWNDTKKLMNIYAIAAAMSYLHHKGYIHRDLKPENIYMDKYLLPIIADFGECKIVPNISLVELSQVVGTLYYIAPELITSDRYTNKVDVYSFAIIVYDIIVNKRPYNSEICQERLLFKIGRGLRPIIPSSVPAHFKALMEKCWDKDPKNRYSFDEILGVLKLPDFITKEVNQDDYYSYVKYVDQLINNYDETKPIPLLEKFVNIKSPNFREIEITKNEIKVEGLDYYSLGLKYEYGDEETEIDKAKAARCYKIAADEGNIYGMIQYGNMLLKGEGIDMNKIEAVDYFKQAADKGSADAMYQCYQLFFEPDHNLIDKTDAYLYLQSAASRGHLDAINEYAMKLYTGDYFQEDQGTALIYLEVAAKDGHVKSMLEYAGIMYRLDNKRKAYEYYKIAAANGSKEAMMFLGYMLKIGDGIPRNLKESNYYFDQASPEKSPKEWYELDSLDDFQISDEFIDNKTLIRKGIVRSTYQMIVSKLASGSKVEQLKNECNNLLKCCYPSIQKVVGMYMPKDSKTAALLTYYCSNSSLKNFLENKLKKTLNANIKKERNEKNTYFTTQYQIIYGICGAMRYLEDKKMFHGNLNPTNVLIDDKNKPILNNIKMKAQYSKEEIEDPDIIINYFAPEIITGKNSTIKSDVYSFGLIINQLFSGDEPYSSATSREELISQMLNEKPTISPKVPEFLAKIVEICLKENPDERYSFTQIMDILNRVFNYDDSPVMDYKKEINAEIQCPITFFRAPKIIVKKPQNNDDTLDLLQIENFEKILSTISHDKNIKILMVCGKYQSGKSTYLRTLTGNGGFFRGEGIKSTTMGILIDGPYSGKEIIDRIGEEEFKFDSNNVEISFSDDPAILFIDSQGFGDEDFKKIAPIMQKYLSFFCSLSDLCINISTMTEHCEVIHEFLKIIRTGQISKQNSFESVENNDENKIVDYNTDVLTKIIFLVRDYNKISCTKINDKFQLEEIQEVLQNDWNNLHKEVQESYFEDKIKALPLGNYTFSIQTYNYTIWNTIPDIVSILNKSANHSKEYIQIKIEIAFRFLFSDFFSAYTNKFKTINEQIKFVAETSKFLVNDAIVKYKNKKINKEEAIDAIRSDLTAIRLIIVPFSIGYNAESMNFKEYNQYIIDLMKDIRAYIEKNIPELKENLFVNFKELILKDLVECVGGGVAAGSVPIVSTICANLAKQVLIQIAQKVIPLMIPGGVIVSIVSIISTIISIGSFVGVFCKNYFDTKGVVDDIIAKEIQLRIPFLWEEPIIDTKKKFTTIIKKASAINTKLQLTSKEIIIALEDINSNFMKFIIQSMTGLATQYEEKVKNKKEFVLYGPFDPEKMIQRYSRRFPQYKSNISHDIYILYLKGCDQADFKIIENIQKKALCFLSSEQMKNSYPTINDKKYFLFSLMSKDADFVFLNKKNMLDFQDENQNANGNELLFPIVMNDFNDYNNLGPLANKCLRWSFNQILERVKVNKDD